MNSKTTLLLAALLAGLVMGYYGLRRQPPPDSAVPSTPPAKSETGIARDLLSEPLGNVVKVVAKRGGEEWTFEKKAPADGGTAVWHMTKPAEAKALSHEIDRIAREAGKIQYEIAYKPGEGEISAQDAGLSPPTATIALTDDAGKSATIDIGKPVSENETYARKAGDETIVVAKSNLRKLLKAKPLEYRDQQLWNFVPETVTQIEICEPAGADQKVECLYLSREGGKWMFERPFSARATSKVDEMLKAVARLRVSGWHDDDPTKLKLYGLDPGALQIAMTVEETITPEKKDEAVADSAADENSPPAPPEKRVKKFNLQVSDRGPIGEDTKVFVRSGDDNAVATIFKTAADKFKPVISEWREMQVVTADATKATRIEVNLGGSNTVLIQKDGQWVFEANDASAESHAIIEFLAAIKGLKAVSFVEGPDVGPAPSFDAPRADIRLTIPGVEGVERVTVGEYTDPAKKLLVYVRRGDSGTIAKVKASEIAALTRPPSALRDRTVFDFASDAVTRIAISRPNTFVSGGRQEFTLERKDELWEFVAPSAAPAQADTVARLLDHVGTLKGAAIVGEAGEATAFGLHEPSAKLTLTALEPIDDENVNETNRPSKTLQLALSEHDGKIYGKRGDGGPIYELSKALFDQVRAEFRAPEALEFEPKDVEKLTIKSGAESNSFVRRGGKWVFEAEPDLPVDSAKIDKILTEAKAIKPDRYAAYASDQLAAFDLGQPQYELSWTLNKPSQPEKTHTLRASAKTANYQPSAPASSPPDASGKPATPQSTTASFATLSGRDGVFLLNSDSVKKLFVPLAELEKK